jgi:hypothetical protein
MEHSPDDPQQTDLSAQPPSVPPSPAHFGSLSPAQQAARRELHEQEVRERLNWCLLRGLTPASEHVHRAPGNDANFMFAEPPWLPDGSVNPRGVPFGRPDDAVLHKDNSEDEILCQAIFATFPSPNFPRDTSALPQHGIDLSHAPPA